jgi:PepSY-associated TM region
MAVLWVRKFLILIHRYLGIVLSVFFVVWFISGIGMMYTGGMPTLTPKGRLERLAPIDFAAIKLTPSEQGENITLLTVMDRPAYRIDGQTIFADTGDTLDEVDQQKAMLIASQYMHVPQDKVRYLELLEQADQWTIEQRGQLPMHKILIDDADQTQVYISPVDGELALLTTRRSRAIAWIAAIPHWLYFRSLRVNDGLWRSLIIGLSGLGCILAIIGLLVGIVQFRRASPHIPYSRWMRWHYLTGAFFGVITFTWVFSGMLSMEPYDVFSGGNTLSMTADPFGASLDMATFPAFDALALNELLKGREAKEIEFTRLQGEPYYVVRTVPERLIVDARAMKIREESFSKESLEKRIVAVTPDPIVESEMLTDYDSYYYSRDREAPLPVLRIKFGDPSQTWLYIDPRMSQIVTGSARINRIQRWIYTGFHDLDFSFWFYRRPLWDIGVIVLSLGGLTSSLIGLCVGFKRVFRGLRRTLSLH